jgi:hypothetical protein
MDALRQGNERETDACEALQGFISCQIMRVSL